MEKSQPFLIRSSVHILGIRQQTSVDHASGWYGIGSAGGDFCSAYLARTDGMFHSSDAPRSYIEHPFQYIIVNLGMSKSFGDVDLEHLPFPVHMKVDYIRVYQPKGEENIGCEPPDFPTQAYINQYIEAYSNPNLTTWVDDYHQTMPR